MSDFSYGVLIMTQLVGFVVTALHSSRHRLMRVTASFLAWLLIVNVFYFIVYYAFAPEKPYLYLLCDILEATVVPCCLFLLLGITHPAMLTRRLIAANTLPYAIAIVVFLLVRSPYVRILVHVLPMLHALGILIYTSRTIREYNEQLLQNYSSLEYIDLKWTRWLVFAFAAWMALWLLFCLFHLNYVGVIYDFFVAVIVAVTVYSLIRHAQTLFVLEQSMQAAEGGGAFLKR